MVIQKDNYTLEVDLEETKKYYTVNSLCECADCRNFHTYAKDSFPILTDFLSDLGIDISRPDELGAHKASGEIFYHFVAYTVVGKIMKSGEYEIDIKDNDLILSISISNSYVPNEQQTENYFTVTIYGINLPWKLDEPYPEEKKNIIDRIRELCNKVKKHNL